MRDEQKQTPQDVCGEASFVKMAGYWPHYYYFFDFLIFFFFFFFVFLVNLTSS